MTEKASDKKNFLQRTPPFLIVLLGGILLYFVMLEVAPNRTEINKADLPWNSVLNQDGNVEALGIETNFTPAIDAKWLFQDDVTVKLFSDKDESNKVAEMFFPSIHIGTIHAAMVLRLNVSEQELSDMYDRGLHTKINQSGNREVVPSQADDLILKQKTFSMITLLPRKDLSEESILKRFGKPHHIKLDDDGLAHWFYPEKGLELLYNETGKDALNYKAK